MLASDSGHQYIVERVLQEKEYRPERVYLASYVISYFFGSLLLFIQHSDLVGTQQRRWT